MESTAASADQLFAEIVSKSQRHKDVRHSSSAREKEQQVVLQQLLAAIREDLKTLITLHPAFSNAPSHDVHGMLWSQCFYKQIEEFRRSIRKHANTIAEDEAPAAAMPGPRDDEGALKARHHFVRLVSTYTKLLCSSFVFYQDLMLTLEDRVKQSEDAADAESYIRSIHRCSLYLGDLSRYREQISEGKEKNYAEAMRYYERAAFLVPSSGNPHNQLAVLATYGNSELVAVYHYCRSVLVTQPSSVGYENLRILFEKNAKAHLQALRQRGEEEEQQGAALAANFSSRKQDVTSRNGKMKVHFFFSQFIRLHGLLFEWSMSKFEPPTASSSKRNPAPTVDIDVEEFTSEVQELMGTFDDLLQAGIFSDALLVRLLIICIFSVHESVPSCHMKTGEEKKIVRNSGPRTIGESLALAIIYGFISKIAAQCTAGGKGCTPKKKILLAPFAVFAEWSSVHDDYLMANTASLTGLGLENPTLFSDAELIRIESRARSGMRSSISNLDKLDFFDVKGEAGTGRNRYDQEQKVLREHVELRGFLPMRNHYERFFETLDPLRKIPQPFVEDDARDRRLRTLKAFVRDWLVPSAQREATEAERRRMLEAKEDSHDAGKNSKPNKPAAREGREKDSGKRRTRRLEEKDESYGGRLYVPGKPRALEVGGERQRSPAEKERGASTGKRVRTVKSADALSSPVCVKKEASYAASLMHVPVAPRGDDPFANDTANFEYEFEYEIDEDEDVDDDVDEEDEDEGNEEGNGHEGKNVVEGGQDNRADQAGGGGTKLHADVDDDMDFVDEVVVFRPTFSRVFTSSPGPDPRPLLHQSASFQSMQSNNSSSVNLEAHAFEGHLLEDDGARPHETTLQGDDASLLLASSSLGDWLAMSSAGGRFGGIDQSRQAPAPIQPAMNWWGGNANVLLAGNDLGWTAETAGGWKSSLGMFAPEVPMHHPVAPFAAPSSMALAPPPGLANALPVASRTPPGLVDVSTKQQAWTANPFRS